MKKPEEIIMAVLAALWVILTYFVLTYIGAHLETSLTITGLTLLWCVVAFVFWQKKLPFKHPWQVRSFWQCAK